MKLKIILLTLFFVISASAQEIDKSIIIDPEDNSIDVYVPPATLEGWNVLSNWTIIVINSNKEVNKVKINKITPDADNSMFSIEPEVSSAALIADAVQVIVNFGKKVVVLPPKKPSAKKTPKVSPESNKQKSDLYFNGSISPDINSDAQYSIDGSAAIMFDLSQKNLSYGQLGFVGSVKTDKRKKMDPDSFRAFLAYQNVPYAQWWGPDKSIQGVKLTWLAAGVEFDKKGDNVNFITAPYLDFPIRLFPKQIRAQTQPMAVFTPSIGFETGWNFKNAVNGRQGQKVFRGFVGADLLFRFNPKIPGFKGIDFTTAYNFRTSAVREIYTLTEKVNGQDVDIPFLNRKPRHYVKSELGFKFNDYFSFSTKYEYGMVPPVFRRVEHKVTFGITFSARQTNDGVPSAIRNK